MPHGVERQLPLGRDEHIRAAMPVAAIVLDDEQPFVGGLGVGQQMSCRGAVGETGVDEETG